MTHVQLLERALEVADENEDVVAVCLLLGKISAVQVYI